jgi:hypothetical protein
MFDTAKRAAGNAVGRAAWEMDKAQRTSGRQRELDLLQREHATLIDQVAGVVINLQQRGLITQNQLKVVAEQLAKVRTDIDKARADIEAIRNEPYVPGAVTIGVQRADPGATMPTPAVTVVGGAGAPITFAPCPRCKTPTPSTASFCSSCGMRLHQG